MPAVSRCPAPEAYRRLLLGQLSSRKVEALAAHLEQCSRCTEVVQNLQTEDPLHEVVRRARAVAAESSSGDVVEGLIEKVCRLRPATVAEAPAASAAETPANGAAPAAAAAEALDFLEPPRSPDELGWLGPYRVLEILGAGGMGIVFLAEDPDLKRRVALKTMKPALAANVDAHQRFLREARALAAMRHDHVVEVYQVGEAGGIPFLAMPLLAGESLADRLDRAGVLPVAEVLRIGREAATGLAAAHAKELVHRDVKPSNIWLEEERDRVKIIDFGLVRPTEDKAGLTRSLPIGTPEYMSPEQANGETVDARTDLYSLGCVLYRACTGRTPIRGKDQLAVLRALALERPRAPRKIDPTIPRSLSALIMRLLSKSRDERPASARAVVQAIEALEQKMEPPQRQRIPRRHWVSLAAAVALLTAVVLVGYGFVSGPAHDPDGQNAAQVKEAAKDSAPLAVRATLAERAHKILRENCHRCHGKDGAIEGGFNYVLDARQLLARGKVKPGQPEKSRLYKRLVSSDNPMPPEGEKPRPSKDDVALIKEWIEAGGPAVATPERPRGFIPERDILAAIRADLESQPESSRFFRYFTIAALYNARLGEDELQTYRHGLAKLLNSLSWRRRIAVPHAIDKEKTIFRIDLRDYRWDAEQWQLILERYPYGVTQNTRDARACFDATGCRVPYVRADWFVFAASRPPLYHDLLKLPRTAAALEDKLGVDVAVNLKQGSAARAGFSGSGVARYNRLIERHESSFGAYWKSYDFGGNNGRKDLFRFPLGPGPGPDAFQHDGGEIIFNLPNGLQGYLLVDGKGSRIDKGPIDLVTDKEAVKKGLNAEVVNGISCMACHARGVIEKADQVREAVLQTPGAFPERKSILALYPLPATLNEKFRADLERFADAVKKTGTPLTATDPIAALALRYEWDLGVDLVAAEVGVKPAALLDELNQAPQALRRRFGRLKVPGGAVSRQVFVEGFESLVSALGVGKFVRPGPPDPPPAVPTPARFRPGEEVVNSIGMGLRLIPAGTFTMGSPGTETDRGADERQHQVEITRPFFMGVYEVTQDEWEKVMGKENNLSHFTAQKVGKDTGRFPVEMVSWNKAKEFCRRLSQREEEKKAGRVYRLPTEAEWEYACRGRENASAPFHFGAAVSSRDANFDGNHPYGPDAPAGNYLNRTAEVGSYGKANDFGLFDMHGNIAEWCADWHAEYDVKQKIARDPKGPQNGLQPVVRGGSWMDKGSACRAAQRYPSLPLVESKRIGFRVVFTALDKAP